MKQIFSLIFAGIIGGMITLGGFHLLMEQSPTTEINTTTYGKKVNQTNINKRAGSISAPFDFVGAAQTAKQSVVHIRAAESTTLAAERRQKERQNDPFSDFFGSDFFSPFAPRAKEGTGSGVIYSKDGYIVTNNHVVGFADEVEVTLHDNRVYSAKIVGTYPQADLAVVKIEGDDLPTLQHADSDAARVGEWVLAVGNPLELNSTVTAGIISAKGRNLDIIREQDRIESFIQTDAVVNPGNSGGALVDAQGSLLGINTAIKTQTGFYAGYSFAIPVNLMEKIVDDIIQHGSYQRVFLGINIFDMDSDYAAENGLNITQGVVIDELVNGGSAQYAGLLPGDVIMSVNQREVRNVPELQEAVGSAKVGETLYLTINRAGKTKEIPVYLKNG